jgi:hypothetical protein
MPQLRGNEPLFRAYFLIFDLHTHMKPRQHMHFNSYYKKFLHQFGHFHTLLSFGEI